MTKGTPSMGKRQKKLHIICRRCGRRSYHIRDKRCSACGFGRTSKVRKYAWQWKTVEGKRRK
jgi:large subunit ribosomal protein L37e